MSGERSDPFPPSEEERQRQRQRRERGWQGDGKATHDPVCSCGHLDHFGAPGVGRQDTEDVPGVGDPAGFDIVDGGEDLEVGRGHRGARFYGCWLVASGW